MADGNISMSHQEMLQAVSDIRARKDALRQFLQQASRTVEQVTGRAYKTRTASGEFKSAHAEWNRSTGQLVDSLNQVADGVEQTKRIDEQTDQQARGRVGQIRNADGAHGAGGTGVVAGAGTAAVGGVAAGTATAARTRVGGSGGGSGGGGSSGAGPGGGSGGGSTGGGSGGNRGGGAGGGPPGGGPPGARSGGPQVDDPNYRPVPAGQRQARLEEIERDRTVNWGPPHAHGRAEYASDRVKLPDGTTYTRMQGMQVTVKENMLRPGERVTSPPSSLKTVLRGYEDKDLQLGHLWADRLGGPNGPHNFVPVYSHVNGGAMAFMEGQVAKAVQQQGSVRLIALPHYADSGPIPESILYAWKGREDSAWTVVRILNSPRAT